LFGVGVQKGIAKRVGVRNRVGVGVGVGVGGSRKRDFKDKSRRNYQV